MKTISSSELQRRLTRKDNVLSVLSHTPSPSSPAPNPEPADNTNSPGSGKQDVNQANGANLPLESHPSHSSTLVESLPPVGSESHKTLHKPGRSVGDSNIPDFLRQIMGTAANVPGSSAKEVAMAFGVSPHTVHDYKHARVNDTHNEELATAIRSNKEVIHKKALDKVLGILNLLDDDEMARLEPVDKARAALSLSRIAETMAPKSDNPFGSASVVIYAPEIRNESNFKTIDVAPDPEGKRHR